MVTKGSAAAVEPRGTPTTATSGPAPDRLTQDHRILFPEVSAGNLRIRLAAGEADLAAAQALRYDVFYDEMHARPSPRMLELRRDFDDFDAVCDHLLVIDSTRGGVDGKVVGTYRMLRGQVARASGGFYSAAEYDISAIASYDREVLEVGRSCVDAAYRTRPTLELLWRGIAQYVHQYDIALIFGCASLHGIDPKPLAMQLSYLYHYHLAPPALRPHALAERRSPMNYMPPDQIDVARAIAALPPLVKGYIRVGAFVGDGAVVDEQFNTTDVCIVLHTDRVTERYARHYERRTRDSRAGATRTPAPINVAPRDG